MGNSKLALGLVLFTVLISLGLAQQRRPEEKFQQCQQRCERQSQYGRGQVGQYECQMRCVRELESQTGRDIDIDVNESDLDDEQWDPEQGRGGRGYDRYGIGECMQRCTRQQGRQGRHQQQQCMSQCQQQQQGRRGEMDVIETRGRRGDREEFSRCIDRCSDQQGRRQMECVRECWQEQQEQGQQGQRGHHQRRQDIDVYESRGRRGDREEYGRCVDRCSDQQGRRQMECVRECQQEQQQQGQQGQRGHHQRRHEMDVNESRGSRGRRGDREEYGRCADRCSDQQGRRQIECVRECQQEQGQQGQRGQQRRGRQQEESQEWDPSEYGGRRGGRGYERYGGECMQRCSRQQGRQQKYCISQCQQQQGGGRGRGGDTTGLASILKFAAAGLVN